MNNLLIDTDVILDFFFDRMPHSEYAAMVLSLCEQNEINGFVTPVICCNVYYLLRQTAPHAKVIGKMRQLLSILDILPMDRNVVMQAIDSGFGDFEDALQNYSALEYGKIDVVITRNVKDYRKSSLGVFTPEHFLKVFQAQRK